MSPQVCHAHCPDEGSGIAVLAGAVALAIVCAVVGAYIGEILWTAAVAVSLLVAGGTWYLVHVLRRDRFVTHHAAVQSQAEVGECRLLSLDVRAPARRRLDAAFIPQQRQGLTDGSERDPVLVSKLTLAGQSRRERPVIDQPAKYRR